jgi:hypothetical protein
MVVGYVLVVMVVMDDGVHVVVIIMDYGFCDG